MNPTGEPSQSEIEFVSRVRQTFESILTPYDLELVESATNRVMYASDGVWLELIHEPYDDEVALYFGRKGTSERFSFLLYLRWRAPNDPAAQLDGVASTVDEVQEVLDSFANALRSSGAPILSGDPETYDQMKDVRWWQSTPDAILGPERRDD